MNALKKVISLIIVFITLFSLFACEEYQYAPESPSTGGDGSDTDGDGESPSDGDPVLNDDPTDDFTVTVTVNGEPYTPRMEIDVYWSDGYSIHSAPLNKQGVARIDGLDGDYRVTLSAVPNEYTYDPNANIATNDDRNIVLELYPLNMLSGSGTGMYDCYIFTKTGVYSAVIEKPGDAIFFEYAPDGSGTYTIESWIDTSADNINPYVDVYIGSSQWKAYHKTTNDGGPVGSYTINFVHTVQIADEMISAGGQAVYTFAVKAESKNNQYPITVTFAVKRNGEFELPSSSKTSTVAIPTYDFTDFDLSEHEYGDEYTVKYPEYQFEGKTNTYVFDEDNVKLWEKKKGGDGFYHIYNEEKYPENDGYGPILYANITSPCRFLDRAFSKIEYNSSGSETINNFLSLGGVNYKHFIEGYTFLSTLGNINGSSYYCVAECPCHKQSEGNAGWACVTGCEDCSVNCRTCPEELIGNEGYQAYANSDGVVPVTKELKEFLCAVCKYREYFYDGKGHIDRQTWNGNYYQAVGDSGWLFACCYYE